MGSNILQLLGVIIVFLLVLAATYYITKWIAKSGVVQPQSKNIKVIETFKIAPNKYIQIVEAGDEYLVIAIGKDEVRLLTKLTREQLKEMPSEQMPSGISSESFKEILEKWKKHIPKK